MSHISNSRREKEQAHQMPAGFSDGFDAVDWREAKALLEALSRK